VHLRGSGTARSSDVTVVTARQPDPVDSCEHLNVDGADHLGLDFRNPSNYRNAH
jgi:hypothetical protein